jgi:hypothetical protein
MIPEKLQEVLKEEGKLLDPLYMYREFNGEPKVPELDWSEIRMVRYTRYANFLEACGHDTRDLLGAVERLRAAAQELRHCSEYCSNQFDQTPFPVTGVAAE